MKNFIIGRKNEIGILEELLQSKQPELLAIYGRRRVGKTFLIKNFFRDHIVFSCTGQHNGKKNEQLINFTEKLNSYFPEHVNLATVTTWQQAFNRLKDALSTIKSKTKKVVFIDELPWLDSHKSGFLSSFSYFWNTYASERTDLIIVICGSAASWIIDKVINDKGGLHNRVTKRIRLLPFTLKETQDYLINRNIRMSHYDLLNLYMVMGGIPAYLNEVKRGRSVAQNIEAICFSKDGILSGEFNNLYAALFTSPENHIRVIQALARKNKGLTREEIVSAGKLSTGGTLSKVLNELEESGFIQKTYPFGKKEKESIYRLTDEFSLFYFKFMHERKMTEKDQWVTKQSGPSYTSWSGYAFENICIKHIKQIKRALQIGAIHSTSASWIYKGNKNEKGAQIDLLIDRADHNINVCEMKFSNKEFVIDKKYAAELENKLLVFRNQTQPGGTVFLTFITTYGVADNTYRSQLIDSEVRIVSLFE